MDYMRFLMDKLNIPRIQAYKYNYQDRADIAL